MSNPTTIGVVADDLTGATDLALMASERGLRAVVHVGLPGPEVDAPASDVLVVALRSRTAPVQEAVEQSRAALAWLRGQGASRFYLKYCSTFDSTPSGNIGPVLEALLDDLGAPMTIVEPAFPTTGRTVYRGYLFVGDELLAESPMRDHPLTPMRDSHLVRLLRPQLRPGSRVAGVPLEEVRGDLAAALARERRGGTRAVVLDAVEDRDLAAIHTATADLPLTTGAAGLVTAWGPGGPSAAVDVRAPGPSVALVGSQSSATAEQIARARRVQPALSLGPPASAEDVDRVAGQAIGWCLEQWTTAWQRPVLLHAAPAEGEVDHADALRLEHMFGRIAAGLAARGVRRFVVGGGETSGSVVAALGARVLRIGPAISPGVCWAAGELDPAAVPGDEEPAPGAGRTPPPALALALKSGNFGGPDFLTTAWELLP